jgi:hypothetical protein
VHSLRTAWRGESTELERDDGATFSTLIRAGSRYEAHRWGRTVRPTANPRKFVEAYDGPPDGLVGRPFAGRSASPISEYLILRAVTIGPLRSA